MRDTLLLIAFLGMMAFGYYASKRWQDVHSPNQPSISSSIDKLNSGKGANHEGTDYQRAGKASARGKKETFGGSAEASEGESGESEGLPSIYSRKHQDSASKGVNVRKPRRKSIIGGVPTDAYIEAKRSSLSLAEVTEDVPQGLRLYLWCMEVKRTAWETATQRQCKHLYGGLAIRQSSESKE